MTDISKKPVPRYKLVRSEPGYSDQMCVRPDGNYVRHADYDTLRAELDRSEARVAELEGAGDLRMEVAFLINRLDTFLGDRDDVDSDRDWIGHVRPSLERLRMMVVSSRRAALADERKEGE